MKTSEKISIGHIIKYAGAFAACAIGSGFATGQEILQFFSAYGTKSIIGTLVTTVLFSWCGALFMKHGYEHRLETPTEVMEFYVGKKAGKYVELLFQIFLFGVYSIMVAGTGATLNEYFGLDPMAGRVLMAVLALLTVLLGLSRFADILGMLGPVIVAFALFVGARSALTSPAGLSAADAFVETASITRTEGGWLWSALLYPAFNAIVVIFLTCSLGRTAASKKEAVCGGIAGGVIFGAAILVMNFGLLANIEKISEAQVPTLILAGEVSPWFGNIFSVIICCGIYTTTVPMLWGTVRHFAPDKTKKSAILAVLFTCIGFTIGLTDFKVLVNTIYPFSGYVGLLLFLVMLYRDIKKEKRTD